MRDGWYYTKNKRGQLTRFGTKPEYRADIDQWESYPSENSVDFGTDCEGFEQLTLADSPITIEDWIAKHPENKKQILILV